MNEQNNRPENNIDEDAVVQGRRELVRKLGKFAAYAAPFTVLALKGKATGGGSGSSTFGSSSRAQARKH